MWDVLSFWFSYEFPYLNLLPCRKHASVMYHLPVSFLILNPVSNKTSMQLSYHVMLFEVNKQKRNCSQATNFQTVAYETLISCYPNRNIIVAISFFKIMRKICYCYVCKILSYIYAKALSEITRAKKYLGKCHCIWGGQAGEVSKNLTLRC